MENILTTKQKISLIAIGVLLLLNVVAWQRVFILVESHYLKVDFLDVGQGDSIFIETPSLRHILIDGGPGNAVLGQLGKHLPLGQKSLDMIILTHPDSDHLNGLLQVIEKYKVDYIVWTGIVRGGSQYQLWLRLLEKARESGSKIIIAKLGSKIKNGQVAMDIINPLTSVYGQDFRPKNNDNDTGIVLHLTYGKNTFLFTADISSIIESKLLEIKANLASDVLKIAHHGSKYSSLKGFLQAVNPRLAVISVGAHNTYGHPTPIVLQRLQDLNITTLRTDQNGTVEILSDGQNLKVSKEKTQNN